MSKTCINCDILKPLDSFYKQKTGYLGYRSQCRDCLNFKRRENYKVEFEKINEVNHDWYRNNTEQRLASMRVYRDLNPNIIKSGIIDWVERNRGLKNSINACYKAAKIQRTPRWLSKKDKEVITMFYEFASELSIQTGIEYHVDHIIPLQGKNISGLHVPSNLQFLTESENCIKSNNFGDLL